MAQDLFGRVPTKARAHYSGQGADSQPSRYQPSVRHAVKAPAEPVIRGRGGQARYYFGENRGWSLDELYRLSGFHQACRDYPDDEICVFLDTTRPVVLVGLIAFPRNHPSRLDEQGRQDPAKQPFWRHGEVIHIQSRPQAPP